MFASILNQINNTEFFVWDAIVAWRNYIYQADFCNSTKGNYLTGMLKLIEAGIIDVRTPLIKFDESFIKDSKQKIDDKPEWSEATKTVRKSCLNSFYNFLQNHFDRKLTPYRRHPDQQEIKHILSSVWDKILTKNISPGVLCNALSKINERDAYIVWLMMHTGQPLEAILDVRKCKEEYAPPYMRFNGIGKHIPEHIIGALDELCKNSTVYLFETVNGRRIRRTQVMRNLKQAGHNIGLGYDLTPKLLHGHVCAYMSLDKRSELEKGLGFSID